MPTSRSVPKKKPAAPAKKPAAPVKKPAAPAKKPAAPVKKPAAPVKKPAAPVKKPPPPASPGKTEVHGSQAAFVRFLPLARAIPSDQVLPLRFDPELAYYNIRVGVQAIEPQKAMLLAELPTLDRKRLSELPELGQALLFATRQAEAADAKPGPSLPELLQQGQKLRAQLLAAADTLAAFELLPGSQVDKIRQGRGSIDAARDLGDLAALYHKHAAAFASKTPVTLPQVQLAAEVGAALLARLSPGGARKSRVRPPSEALTDRDRLATLLQRWHRDLRRAAYWIWGDDFDAHVPPLLSRAVPRKKPAPPTPSAPPAPNG
ncbi:MAG: hypothetical protein JNM83_03640 [Myxococcales bacterium]|nr:hypothetical protein [Myxococcales bacterium]